MLVPPLIIEKRQYHNKSGIFPTTPDVPIPTTSPSFNTMILSACMIVPTRCATINTVDSVVSFSDEHVTSHPFDNLMLKSCHQKYRISGRRMMALAIANRCFCPPEKLEPPSDKCSSNPSGFREMNSEA